MSLIKTVTEKPWERKGVIGGMEPEGTFDTEAERVALTFFLVIATVIFSLFMVSYYIRMELPDWEPLSEPAQLWFNTGLLVASSMFFQWARNIVSRGDSKNLYTSFFGAGVLALLFIVAQLVTWNHLQAGGFYLSSNPANAFYYLLTGLHALHLAGGLWVWSKSAIRLVSSGEPEDIRLSIELCSVYWHFLLLVWIVMFAVLSNT
ncbi:MAG: cytochrome-c oxidase [Gammaproteobacteria bacterium]|jgi:cytochrome c oxidase subunit 3|nr:cytochrome-c oxidase [Gammaproteobacteria bacterium]|tara:strand:+ start:76 stop:690 length:615 start_codon:yes stop_codon:yes gene_type:complete